ncbi:phage antirepressor KilAC domain-containing protein [Candidatus Symbiobacter mobilis]|uniref:Phage anti-repressor protein n=1 Tax=Candidatus Symbiobacter mobilis CR TaxID=946483 RepID=U5NBP1_9BURK|nr:phage antirepressor KilAC domain-containing protein [Candidatus Symbiobacter mobilis]AGX87658.1 phage anti-repressor protein [Candidatus Symbiobacter mobilis CR]
MENALIPVGLNPIGAAVAQTVNARDLHSFLEVGKDFSTWIKDRIEKYDFVENQDFVIDSPNLGNQNGRGGDRRSLSYHLALDMAKELSMVENNAKGRQARRYFIDCEREAKEAKPRDPMQVLNDPAAMRGLLLNYTEKVLNLEKQVGELAPKAEALDLISTAEGAMCITNAAKNLQMQPKKLFAWLQENQWIYRRAGGKCYAGYQARIQVGYLEHKITTVERADGTIKQAEQVLVTAKGLAKLATDICKELRTVREEDAKAA